MPLESDVEGLGLYTSNHHPKIRFTVEVKSGSSWLTESRITEHQSLSWTTTTFALGHYERSKTDESEVTSFLYVIRGGTFRSIMSMT